MNTAEQAYVESLEQQVKELRAQLDWFTRQLFGTKSERIVNADDQQLLFEGMEPPEAVVETVHVPAKERKIRKSTGKDKIALPEGLRVEKILLDLTEEEKTDHNGKPLVCIGEEISQKLAYKPGSYFIKSYVRPKYALSEGEGIKMAELPDFLIPKCRADESLLAHLCVQKFADHLPLYRISEILRRQGIGITRQLLSQWILSIGDALEPLYNLMHKRVLESQNLFIDETPLKLLVPGNKKAQTAYMWVMVGGLGPNPSYRIYNFHRGREHQHAKYLLRSYRGVFHSDKYGAYEKLAQRKELTWSPCYSHIRRKFFEAASGDLRDWFLRHIRYLFLFERIAWSRSSEERLVIRQQKEIPIIDELIDRAKKEIHNALPQSPLRKALGYLISLIPHLKNYTKYPHAHLDNNIAERAIRPLALGRKNWLFAGSEKGGQAAATILSLVQTCRGLGINPQAYLEDVFQRLMSNNAQLLDELLPDRWSKERECSSSDPPG